MSTRGSGLGPAPSPFSAHCGELEAPATLIADNLHYPGELDIDELTAIRRRIDSLDLEILELLQARAELALQAATIKRHRGLPLRDREREEAVLANVAREVQAPLTEAVVRKVFCAVLAAAAEIQEIADGPTDE